MTKTVMRNGKRVAMPGSSGGSSSSGSSSPQTLTTAQKRAGVRIERTTDSSGNYSYSAPTTAFAAESVGTTPAIKLPETPTISDPGSILTGNNAGLGSMLGELGYSMESDGQFKYTAPATTDSNAGVEQGFVDNFKSYLGLLAGNEPPNSADIYAKEEKAAGIKQKQQEVNNYTAQLNSIVAKANADQLRVEGQGRGIPEAIIGGQQAQINKEAAIAALPVQALLSAATGNLQMAQEHVDKMFQIRSADATAQWQYKTNVINSVYDFATKAQQRKLDSLNLTEERKYADKKDNISYARQIAGIALQNGQSGVFRQITALDPNSSTYSQEIARLGGQIAIAQDGDTAPTVKTINGVDMQWNPQSGKWETIDTGVGGNSLQLSQAQSDIGLIDTLLKNTGIRSAVGTTGLFGRFVGRGLDTLTGKRQDFVSSVEQIRSQLTLDSLVNAKKNGATFGALSDREMSILSSSASKLGTWAIENKDGKVTGYNTSEKSFKQEMDKINNFAKLDYILKGGDPVSVGVQVMPDGTYVTVNSDGTYTIIR